jgi:hypothetical protein
MISSVPRRVVTFPFSTGSRAKLMAIENLLAYGLAFEIYVPLWHSLSRLTAAVSGSATLYCDATGRDFDQVEKLAVIAADLSSYATRTISSVGTAQIAVTTAVTGFSIGDFVLPIIPATPAAASDLEWKLAAFGKGTLEFTEIDPE